MSQWLTGSARREQTRPDAFTSHQRLRGGPDQHETLRFHQPLALSSARRDDPSRTTAGTNALSRATGAAQCTNILAARSHVKETYGFHTSHCPVQDINKHDQLVT